jgi:hypothetical protein
MGFAGMGFDRMATGDSPDLEGGERPDTGDRAALVLRLERVRTIR